MNSVESTSKKIRNPLPWILIGMLVAPVITLLLSYLLSNPEIREMSMLFVAPTVGGVVGWVVYAINPLGKPHGWNKPVVLIVTLIVYIMVVLFGFIASQLRAFGTN